MLKKCKDECIKTVCDRTTFTPGNIMIYAHLPPSTYQLHLHIACPYSPLHTTSDTLKLHPIDNIISNLEIDSDFYKKASITTVVVGHGELLNIYTGQK